MHWYECGKSVLDETLFPRLAILDEAEDSCVSLTSPSTLVMSIDQVDYTSTSEEGVPDRNDKSKS